MVQQLPPLEKGMGRLAQRWLALEARAVAPRRAPSLAPKPPKPRGSWQLALPSSFVCLLSRVLQLSAASCA